MANKFTITIQAVDKATAIVRGVKKSISQITKPIRDVTKSVGNLAKEIGLKRVAAGFANVAKSVVAVAGRVFGLVGAIAGVAGAATLGAIASLTREWTAAGFAVLNFSMVTGVAARRVQTLTGAAGQFNISADSMKAGLKSIGDTFEDSVFGRNQEALMMMNRLKIRLHRTKDGAVDAADGLMQIADAIVRIKNVQAQGVVARTFGVEDLLPMLQKGSRGIKEAEEQVRKTNSVLSPETLKKMADFQKQINLLSLGISGLGSSIGSRLLPYLQPATAWLTNFIEKTTVAIQQKKLLEFLLDEGRTGMGKVMSLPGTKKSTKPLIPVGLSVKGNGPVYMDPIPRFLNWMATGSFRDPRGIRSNNPGNLRSWGHQPVVGGYAAFRKPGEGISAMVQNLLVKQTKHGLNTISQIIGDNSWGWANARAGNNVPAYVSDVAKRMHMGGDTRLNLKDPKQLAALTNAIIAHENGKSPYSDAMINAAVKQRLGAQPKAEAQKVVVEFKGTPPGTRVKSGQTAPSTTVRVNYAMPEVGGI